MLDLNKLYYIHCLDGLRQCPDGSADLLATDPPYGLSFMGRDWDKAIPKVIIWKECYRVLKPGSFSFVMCIPRQDCLSRMIVNLGDAGFRTDFTSIYWTYACLSKDTEVLTKNGWERWHNTNTFIGKEILVYDCEKDEYKWEIPQKWNFYKIKDTCYRIKSDFTDQLVTRNHRVAIEKEGKILFKSAEKIRQEVSVPYMENLPVLQKSFFDVASGSEKEKKSRDILFNSMSPESSNLQIYNRKREAYSSNVRRTEATTKRKHDGSKKSSLEGRSDIFQKKRDIRKILNQICTLPRRIQIYVTEGWLCNGSSPISCSTIEQTASKNGSGASYKSQPRRQSLGELGVICEQSAPQKKRKRTSYKTTMARITKEWYEGIVYCPTVSTGYFLARRNGKIFITGNSGFPKSQNIGLTIDKRECRKQLTKKLGRKPTKDEFNESWKTFREVVGKGYGTSLNYQNKINLEQEFRPKDYYEDKNGEFDIAKPATPQAKALDGSYAGFQPKPAIEIIIVAMKPVSEKTYIDQALKNKKGITWLRDCKIPYISKEDKEGARYGTQADIRGGNLKGDKKPWGVYGKNILASSEGRFPANLLVSDDILNDGKKWKAGGSVTGKEPSQPAKNVYGEYGRVAWQSHGDSGSYSRYFDLDAWFNKQMKDLSLDIQNTFPFIAIPKARRSERDLGLEKMEDGDRKTPMAGRGQEGLKCKKCGKWKHSGSPCKCLQPEFEKIKFNRPSVKNIHPTVKPLKLMAYLVVLGSRKGDVVLDPYMGSGTTGLACKLLNRNYIGFENNADYYKIAQARLSADIKKYRVYIDKKLIRDDEPEDEPPKKDYSTRLDKWI